MVNSTPSARLSRRLLLGKRGGMLAAGLLWLAIVGGGMGRMMQFERTPGVPVAAADRWPAASHLKLAPRGTTLVLLAHPKCSCTMATLEELAALLQETHGALTARVLFFQPAEADPSWAHTELWRTASALPHVTVSADPANHEAHLFGAETSGSALLFDADGRLLFRGGLTDARGEFGESAGRRAITDLVGGHKEAVAATAVYGCPLNDRTNSLTTSLPRP